VRDTIDLLTADDEDDVDEILADIAVAITVCIPDASVLSDSFADALRARS
jgi:hypothetical protein